MFIKQYTRVKQRFQKQCITKTRHNSVSSALSLLTKINQSLNRQAYRFYTKQQQQLHDKE